MDRKLPRLTYHQYYNQLRYINLPSEENLVKNNNYSLILKRLDYYKQNSRGLMQAAVEQGNIFMLQFIKDTLFSRTDLREFQWLDRLAGTIGNIEVIKWLDTQGLKITSNTLRGAIEKDHYDIGGCIIRLGILPDRDTIRILVNSNLFDWFTSFHPWLISPDWYIYAIRQGKVSILEKLDTLGIPFIIEEEDLRIFPSDLAIVEWLIDHNIIPTSNQIEDLVRHGDLDLIDFLYLKGLFPP